VTSSSLVEFNDVISMNILVQFAASVDDDFLRRPSVPGSHFLDVSDDVHALDDLSEDDVGAVQPGRLGRANEELGAVGSGSGVGHRQNARPGVLQREVLVLELGAVNRLAARAVVTSEITTLAHELRDDSVKGGSFVAESLFPGAEGAEVFGGFGDDVSPQLHDDSANLFAVGAHVEVHLWQGSSFCGQMLERRHAPGSYVGRHEK